MWETTELWNTVGYYVQCNWLICTLYLSPTTHKLVTNNLVTCYIVWELYGTLKYSWLPQGTYVYIVHLRRCSTPVSHNGYQVTVTSICVVGDNV